MAIEPMTDHQFREQLETLVSYNVCNDGVCQDCIYIKQGHYMNPTTFQSNSMAIDPRRFGSGNMDTSHYAQLPVATIPALVSTGITILYFVLKLLNYLTDAKPGQTNRKETERQTDQEGQPKQGTDQRRRSAEQNS